MLYTEKEKHEIERVKEVFAEHLRQSPDFELLWSDKVGYVWLAIGVNPLYVDRSNHIYQYRLHDTRPYFPAQHTAAGAAPPYN